MGRSVLIGMVLLLTVAVFPPPKAQAIDPITMAILAPIAVKVAEVAKPYVIKAVLNTGVGMFKIGKDAFELLYLPYGLGEATIGAPFHRFRRGMVHMVRGGVVAPARLVVHILVLPMYMVGGRVNI